VRRAWLLLPSLLGCQGSYPLAPTLCDEWCDATQQSSCFTYDPAGCVASCERQGLDSAVCAPLVKTAVACAREHPPQERSCVFESEPSAYPCAQAIEDATTCTTVTAPPDSSAD